MSLSNKKRKYIHRQSNRKDPDEIANVLKIPLEEVLAELEKIHHKKNLSSKNTSTGFLVWTLCGMVLLAPFIVVPSFTDLSDMPKKTFVQIGSLMIFGVWLRALYNSRKVEIRKCPLYLPLAIIIVWSLLSVFWANDGYNAFTQWAHWAACGLIFITILNLPADNLSLRRILFSFFISTTLVSLFGLTQYYFELDWVRQTAPPAATFVNRNHASQYVVLGFPLGFVFFLMANPDIS